MHWFIIGCIYDSGDAGIRLTDLTRSLQITLPYVTTAINFLESRGIVVKKAHDTDARIKLASIAPSYLLTVEEIETGLDETMRTQLYDHVRVSREELQSYINVLYKIAESDPRSA
jgi:DNA-binding MarR family transcriptional regulator